MKKSRYLLGLLFTSTLFFNACTKDVNPDEGIYGPGIYVSNEGAFGASNGSISYIPRNTYTPYNDIYALANDNAVLGDVVQSINFHNNKFYIVVNNSGYVKVVDAVNFKIAGTISDRNLPRYMVFRGDRGYLTEWQSFITNGKVSVINPNNNSVVKQINVGKFPEKMLIYNDQLFVVNSNDSTVHVIDLVYDVLDYSFTVGDWPNSIVKDSNNKLWILCGGVPSWAGTATPGKLIRYNPSTQTIELELEFPNTSANPNNLCINSAGNELYYHFNGGVYKMNTNSVTLPTTPLISKNAYGLGVDPTSGYIFVADAGNFTSNGVVYWYNTSGSRIDTAVVGVAPNGFYFWEP
ncbi:MAG: hypothetical protein N2167_01550 [Flavobacteriales bacterium]|nr:hypothetical protein [Flavobacteriales bacterium]